MRLRPATFCILVLLMAGAFWAGYVAGRIERNVATTRRDAKAAAHDFWRARALAAEGRLLEQGDPSVAEGAGRSPSPDPP